MISWCNWSICDKEETAAALIPEASATGGWSEFDLTESGDYIRTKIIDLYENPLTDLNNEQNKKSILNFQLFHNYPNPFNPATIISYTVEAHHDLPLPVNLTIYNLLGQKVKTLVSEKQRPGTYQVNFDGSNLPSGIYVYRLKVDTYQNSKKMTLIK